MDVADCASAVKLLGEQGLIDPKRVVIRGESIGGYTALQALIKNPEVWVAGTSIFGVSDLVALDAKTRTNHKFKGFVDLS